METHNAAYGIGFLFVVHKAHAHDAIHNLYARLFTGLAHDFHELGAVEHERLDGALVGRTLALDAVVGTVGILLEDNTVALEIVHAIPNGLEMLPEPVLIVDEEAFLNGLAVPEIVAVLFLDVGLEGACPEGAAATLAHIGLVHQYDMGSGLRGLHSRKGAGRPATGDNNVAIQNLHALISLQYCGYRGICCSQGTIYALFSRKKQYLRSAKCRSKTASEELFAAPGWSCTYKAPCPLPTIFSPHAL